MPYDKDIEQNIEAIYAAEEGLTSKHMFGGVCYLYRGNMAFGVYKDNVIVRLGSHNEATRQIDSGQALPFDITGKAMKGWVMIPKAQLTAPQDYRQWLDRGLRFAKSLPPK
jgi:TfoX/Sxy family transcriptional regulator of competence genes